MNTAVVGMLNTNTRFTIIDWSGRSLSDIIVFGFQCGLLILMFGSGN